MATRTWLITRTAAALLAVQGLGGAAAVLAHAREAPAAHAAVEPAHDSACVVVHDAARCAICHAPGVRVGSSAPLRLTAGPLARPRPPAPTTLPPDPAFDPTVPARAPPAIPR